MTGAPLVFVIDNDPSVPTSLKFLISTVGLQIESFESAEAFLRGRLPEGPSCVVLHFFINRRGELADKIKWISTRKNTIVQSNVRIDGSTCLGLGHA